MEQWGQCLREAGAGNVQRHVDGIGESDGTMLLTFAGGDQFVISDVGLPTESATPANAQARQQVATAQAKDPNCHQPPSTSYQSQVSTTLTR